MKTWKRLIPNGKLFTGLKVQEIQPFRFFLINFDVGTFICIISEKALRLCEAKWLDWATLSKQKCYPLIE